MFTRTDNVLTISNRWISWLFFLIHRSIPSVSTSRHFMVRVNGTSVTLETLGLQSGECSERDFSSLIPSSLCSTEMVGGIPSHVGAMPESSLVSWTWERVVHGGEAEFAIQDIGSMTKPACCRGLLLFFLAYGSSWVFTVLSMTWKVSPRPATQSRRADCLPWATAGSFATILLHILRQERTPVLHLTKQYRL